MIESIFGLFIEYDVSWTLYLYEIFKFPALLLFPFTVLGSVWCVFAFLAFRLLKKLAQTRQIEWKLLHPVLSLVFFMALTELLKISVGRLRPEFFLSLHQLALPFSLNEMAHSFPSSHAAVLFFIARYQQNKIWYGLGLLTGFSRLLLLRHFLFDVGFGFFWGWTLGWLFSLLVQAFRPSFIPKFILRFIKKMGWEFKSDSL